MGSDRVMDDSTLYERMLDSMEVSYVIGLERPIRRPGVTAALCPTIPHRSVFNSVVYRDPAALEAALPELARAYEEAGVLAWTVWRPEEDARARAALEAGGHVLDSTPQAMAAPLDEVDAGDGASGLDWERADGVDEMCAILADAFGLEPEPTSRVLAGFERVGHIYLARRGGRSVACVAAFDVGGDAGIYYVGTLAEARGAGLATGLMRQALLDARERGCTTTSLQATAMGRPVYRRLGFRELGVIEMWERRHPNPAS
jgi:GNAT superfamily N-acetyltransferase